MINISLPHLCGFRFVAIFNFAMAALKMFQIPFKSCHRFTGTSLLKFSIITIIKEPNAFYAFAKSIIFRANCKVLKSIRPVSPLSTLIITKGKEHEY